MSGMYLMCTPMTARDQVLFNAKQAGVSSIHAATIGMLWDPMVYQGQYIAQQGVSKSRSTRYIRFREGWLSCVNVGR